MLGSCSSRWTRPDPRQPERRRGLSPRTSEPRTLRLRRRSLRWPVRRRAEELGRTRTRGRTEVDSAQSKFAPQWQNTRRPKRRTRPRATEAPDGPRFRLRGHRLRQERAGPRHTREARTERALPSTHEQKDSRPRGLFGSFRRTLALEFATRQVQRQERNRPRDGRDDDQKNERLQ